MCPLLSSSDPWPSLLPSPKSIPAATLGSATTAEVTLDKHLSQPLHHATTPLGRVIIKNSSKDKLKRWSNTPNGDRRARLGQAYHPRYYYRPFKTTQAAAGNLFLMCTWEVKIPLFGGRSLSWQLNRDLWSHLQRHGQSRAKRTGTGSFKATLRWAAVPWEKSPCF